MTWRYHITFIDIPLRDCVKTLILNVKCQECQHVKTTIFPFPDDSLTCFRNFVPNTVFCFFGVYPCHSWCLLCGLWETWRFVTGPVFRHALYRFSDIVDWKIRSGYPGSCLFYLAFYKLWKALTIPLQKSCFSAFEFDVFSPKYFRKRFFIDCITPLTS